MPAHCPLPAVPAAFPQPLLFSLSGFNKNKQKPLFFSFKKQTRFLFSRSLPGGGSAGSLFALHSASYQGAFDESAFSCSYFGLEQLVTLSGSLPGSVPAVAVRPTSSSMCLLASSIAAGCTFCSQRRFKVIAAVKVPIASREQKLLAGKQEVAEVAEVAGDAERVLNGGSKATGSPPLVHREARSEQAANSSKSSRLSLTSVAAR